MRERDSGAPEGAPERYELLKDLSDRTASDGTGF